MNESIDSIDSIDSIGQASGMTRRQALIGAGLAPPHLAHWPRSGEGKMRAYNPRRRVPRGPDDFQSRTYDRPVCRQFSMPQSPRRRS
jgi:hypothetical protein